MNSNKILRIIYVPINRYYQALVRDTVGEPFSETVRSSMKLEIKLNKKYEKQIKIERGKTIRGNIVYSSLMYSGNVIRFVADKWLNPSIKDIEYIDQDAVSITYKISGPSQKRPTDWTVALKNSSFKESLIELFVKRCL